MIVGKSVPRVDAFDKVTGRAKYTDDLCDKSALLIRVVRSTIAHGFVKSVDISEAMKVPGVVRIFTCFDVPDIPFPTAGHPWSVEEAHQDVADRLLLNRHVRYSYTGDSSRDTPPGPALLPGGRWPILPLWKDAPPRRDCRRDTPRP